MLFRSVTHKIDRIGTYSDAVLADFNGDLKLDLVALPGRIRPSGVQRVSANQIEAWLSAGGTVDFEKSFSFGANGPITVEVYARTVGQASGIKVGASGYAPSRLPVTLDPNDSQNWGVVSNRNQTKVYIGYSTATQEWSIHLSGGGRGGGEGAYITVSANDLTEPKAYGLKYTDGPIKPEFLFNSGSRLVRSGGRGTDAVSCGGIAAADFDNDMDVDLYFACRTATANIPNRIYLNNGDGTFTAAPGGHGGEGAIGAGIEGRKGTAEMAVTADYDLDGFMDLYVNNGNRLFPHIVKDKFTGGGPTQLLRNRGNSNHWLQFDLQGIEDNRDGFGVKVIVTAAGKAQLREQNGQYHRWSHDSQRLHFGLGANTSAQVRVEWPDGSVHTHHNVAANRLYLASQDGLLTDISPQSQSPLLSVRDVSVTEGEIAAVIVSLNQAISIDARVDFRTSGMSAVAQEDFSGQSGTLTFRAGETTKHIDIATLKDSLIEGDEYFELRLSNATNVGIAQGVGTITIKDSIVTPTISIDSVQVLESDPYTILTISLSPVQTSSVSVGYATQDDTATAGTDYVARGPARMTFSPGQTTKIRRIDLLDDGLVEGDETFSLELTNASGASLGQTSGTIRILDDDTTSSLPTISVTSAVVSESTPYVAVMLSLSQVQASRVFVDYATKDGSAKAGEDYVARALGTMSFSPGQISKVRQIQLLNDNAIEADEYFSFVLSNPVGALLDVQPSVITIKDDDKLL